MTAIATGIDWAAIRREYSGGDRGVTLGDLSKRHMIPLGTLHFRSAQEGWANDSAYPATRAEIRRRMKQLVSEGAKDPARILRQLSREYGHDHPGLPSLAVIRHAVGHTHNHRTRAEILEPEPINGLRRHCFACGQITRANPCNHCGDRLE